MTLLKMRLKLFVCAFLFSTVCALIFSTTALANPNLLANTLAQTSDETLAGAVIVQPKDKKHTKQISTTAAVEKNNQNVSQGSKQELGHETAQKSALNSIQNSVQEADQIKEEIQDLNNLIIGKLPENLSFSALFEVDLEDEKAVSQRVISLTERLETQKSIIASKPSDILSLRIERDQLRLAFLTLPHEQRKALIAQDRLNQRSKELDSEQKKSEEAFANSEKARDNALSTANKATDDTVRILATEEARLLAHLSELASLRQSWVLKNQTTLDQHRQLLATYIDANQSANATINQQIKPENADQLYEKIRIDLRNERASASLALSEMTAPTSVRSLDNFFNVNDAKYSQYEDSLHRIRQLKNKVNEEEINLRLRETNDRYAQADEVMRTLRALQAKRIELLPFLTPAKREQVTGFTKDGWNRIVSEVDHVQLMIRWYPIERMHEAKNFASLLHDVFEAGKFGAEIFGFAFVLSLLIIIIRRGRRWLSHLRRWLVNHIASITLMRRVDSAMQMLIRICNELFILLAVFILFDQILKNRLNVPEIAVLRSLAYAYAFYLLAIAFIHRVLLVTVSRYRVVEPSLNEKILRSLRLIARVVLIFIMYLIIAKAMLGEGALYGINKKIALMVALFLAWRLMRDWRLEITKAYLNFSPTGQLAEMVRNSQEHSYGLLIAATAFLYVATRGIWIWLRDAALSFEQTRKALAYLFRRQLERQSKNQVEDRTHTILPEELVLAFSEEAVDVSAVEAEQFAIDYFPYLEEVELKANDLIAHQQGMLIALKGERGSGKTSWLMALQKRMVSKLPNTLPCTLYTLEKRVIDAQEACLLLSQIVKVPETSDCEQLIQSILDQPAQIVLIDLGQNLMLRDVGGLAAYEVLLKVAQATVSKIIWVVSFSRWAFEYLRRTQPDRDVYDKVIELAPWSERKIAQLLESRLTHSGFTAEYDQLIFNKHLQAQKHTNSHKNSHISTHTITHAERLANRIAFSKSRVSTSKMATHAIDEMDEVEKIADRYYRLIWDYADGNPRVALHFFRLSLHWTSGKKVTVRLFPLPSMNALEKFEKHTHYLLACLVQHENISIQDAASSLRFPIHDCARAMHLLQKEGFVSVNDDGAYRITSHWSRAVLRFLNRKKLLAI